MEKKRKEKQQFPASTTFAITSTTHGKTFCKPSKKHLHCSGITCTPQCSYRVGVHTELNPPADRYMWGVGLHAACIRVPVGGVECLRQTSSSSDPLPTGMGEAASSWDFTLLLSVWLQMLPLPTGCFSSVCATPLWSMANKYERPTAHRGMAGGVKKTATIVLECVSDINGIFVVPANSLCGKWRRGSKKQNGKRRKI